MHTKYVYSLARVAFYVTLSGASELGDYQWSLSVAGVAKYVSLDQETCRLKCGAVGGSRPAATERSGKRFSRGETAMT